MRKILVIAAGAVAAVLSLVPMRSQTPPVIPNPILFVTQVPFSEDFASVTAAFDNQMAGIAAAPRGGDLWILYPDGTLKNLTAAAGYGMTGLQGQSAIAVRDPSVDWSGQKAVFSMVVGAPKQYAYPTYLWQMYEVTGLGETQTPVITKVANQGSYNNVNPTYGSDERIIFSSDMPRNQETWTYPQLDEYESTATNTGLWSLNPATGAVFQLNHTPSGAFHPSVDSFGRVIYTRWDHLQRDQQADIPGGPTTEFGAFNYASEAQGALSTGSDPEVFPEPRPDRTDLLAGTNMVGLRFDQFFPWTINQDGTFEETLNHIGRHELLSAFPLGRLGDPAIVNFTAPAGAATLNNFLQVREDPNAPGTYYGVDCNEDGGTHSSGSVVSLYGPPGLPANEMQVTYQTSGAGQYRNPLPLSNGVMVMVYTSSVGADTNLGTEANPQSRYSFRLSAMTKSGGVWTPGQLLTPGISKTLTYYDPNVLATYNGLLWELDPVEVVARPAPPMPTDTIQPIEQNVLNEEGVNLTQLVTYLQQNNLAIMVSRNVTTRDHADRQQPYNLQVAGSETQTIGGPGQIYDLAFLQFMQGDLIRAYTKFNAGRRVLATPMHDTAAFNIPNPAGPVGSVQVASDGSVAAFVPARRAMSWQITDASGNPLIRERYWLTFQPGEIRTCPSCHGVNTIDQAGAPAPVNEPQALHLLLQQYEQLVAAGVGVGTGGTSSGGGASGGGTSGGGTSGGGTSGGGTSPGGGTPVANSVTFQQGVNGYSGAQDGTIETQYLNQGWDDGLGSSSVNSPSLDLRNTTNVASSGFESRSLIRFSGISIPAGSTLTGATLTVTFVNWNTPGTLNGYYLNTPWSPASTSTLNWAMRAAGLEWASPGASGNATDRVAGTSFTVSGFVISGADSITIPLDVGVVGGWLSNPSSNQGVLLVNPTVGWTISAFSSEATAVNDRPILTLYYQ